MAERLNEAEINEPEISEVEINEPEINEDVTSLHEINEFNLDRAAGRFLNWTPLHDAASRGQQELFKELLSSSPELADALDSHQRSVLHLASANGHIEIVKALTEVRPEMCLTRDRDGANPLHVAAMRGKVNVLDELYQANPHAARAYRVDRGERETILHLCVKYNQLQFLSMLLKKYFKGKEFVNTTDNVGNTILHLAVADRRYEIIEYVLIHTEIDVKATNASKQTAMDILLLGQKNGTKPEGVDKDIRALLQHYGGAGTSFVDPTRIAERKNGIIVVSLLMATLLFQTAVTPPGGVWQDDKGGHKIGGAVMASTHPKMHAIFLYYNMFGFFTSLSTIFLIAGNRLLTSHTLAVFTYIGIGATMTSIGATYWISLTMFSTEGSLTRFAVRRVLGNALITFSGVYLILFVIGTLIVCYKQRRNYRAVEMVNRRRTDQASVNGATGV